MKIRIISVGKMKERYWKEAQQEYSKMLSRFATVEVVEVADERTPEDASAGEIRAILKKEGERVRAALKGVDRFYALASEGTQEDSVAFSRRIAREADSTRSLGFVIGGSFGLAEDLKRDAAGLVSFSKMTFPHRLARIILFEQLFRAFKIAHGETYHK